jgi:hypothetical protein
MQVILDEINKKYTHQKKLKIHLDPVYHAVAYIELHSGCSGALYADFNY